MRRETLEPANTVPVVTENCLRQPFILHFHTRRWLMEPVRVARSLPDSLRGLRNVALSMTPQCGQTEPRGQRSSSRYS